MTMESFVIGIILFICSAITVLRYSDEVEAIVPGLEEWNKKECRSCLCQMKKEIRDYAE